MKKIVALVLSLVMVLGLATTAFGATAYTKAEVEGGSIAGFVGFDAKLELAEKETDEEFAVYTVLMVAKKPIEVTGSVYYAGEYERGEDFDLQTAAGNDEWVIVDGNGAYEYAIVDGKNITYIADADDYNDVDYVEAAWETKADVVVLPVMPDAAADVKCDTYYTNTSAITEFFWYEDTLYTAYAGSLAGDYVFNVDGVAVEVVEVVWEDGTTVNGHSYVNNNNATQAYGDVLVTYTSPNYVVEGKGDTYGNEDVTAVSCDGCKAKFGFTPYGPVDATKMFGEYGWFVLQFTQDTDDVLWVELKASAATDAPAADKDADGEKVESAETFDAGIAMYVGMSVMAAAGSAVVLKKKD